MRILRGAAWTVFCLDLVILAQMAYAAVTATGATAQALTRGLTMLLGSGLLGVGVVLVASSWLRSKVGLWISLVCAAMPLLWVASGMVQTLGD